jgi:NAD(P)H-nitrite reductase large subunit
LDENRLSLVHATADIILNTAEKLITPGNGSILTYDQLLLATV